MSVHRDRAPCQDISRANSKLQLTVQLRSLPGHTAPSFTGMLNPGHPVQTLVETGGV